MKLTGEQVIQAPREVVWQGLNDPEILKQSISGCKALKKTSDTQFEATVTAKVGPVKADFSGDVTLSELNPPESYVISGQGKGGVAGFAKGGAHVTLVDEDGATRLIYDVDAQVGGKLAQIGSRLVQSTAKKMAQEFFATFSTLVGQHNDEPTSVIEQQVSPEDEEKDVEIEEPEEPATKKTPAPKKARATKAKRSVRTKAAAKTRGAAKKSVKSRKTRPATKTAGKKSARTKQAPAKASPAEVLEQPAQFTQAASTGGAVGATAKSSGKVLEPLGKKNMGSPFWWIVGLAILLWIVYLLRG